MYPASWCAGAPRLARSAGGFAALLVATLLFTPAPASAASPAPPAPASAASPSPWVYDATAYASWAVGSGPSAGVRSGPTYLATVSCTMAPRPEVNAAGAVDVAHVVTSSAVSDTIRTADDGAAQTETARSSVSDLSLLDGVVSAESAVATTTATQQGGTVSTTGALWVSRLVAGPTLVNGAVAPNTRITLPGVGSLTLNEQVVGAFARTTIGLHLRVTTGPRAGLDVVVASARAGFGPHQAAIVGGWAYSERVAAGAVQLGAVSIARIPCRGGTSTATAASSGLTGVVTTGSVTSVGRSTVSSAEVSAEAVAEVQAVDVLGLVSARSVRADAHLSSTGTATATSDAGTVLTDLKVRGVAVGSVAANTRLEIGGVGTLYLNVQIRTPVSLEIRMIDLRLTAARSTPAGVLPAGTIIQVGVARVQTG